MLRFIKRGILAVLGVLLVGSTALNLHLYLSLAECRDRRPAGDTLTLKRDAPVYLEGSSGAVFTLPRGTHLQDSTPRGMATLGKFYGHEFILVLRQGDETGGWQIDPDLFDHPQSNPDDRFSDDYSLFAPRQSSQR